MQRDISSLQNEMKRLDDLPPEDLEDELRRRLERLEERVGQLRRSLPASLSLARRRLSEAADYAERAARVLGSHERAAEMSVAAAARARRYTWSIAAGRLRRLYADLTARQLVECR